jgi:hypothetical protein
MKRLLATGVTLALLAGAATARAGHHKDKCAAPCPGECAPAVADQIVLHAQVTEQKCTVPLPPLVPTPGAVVTTSTCDVPATRMVPVTVVDPCTGCPRTELRPEAVVEKARTATIEITPPPPDCKPRTEERIRHTVVIAIEHRPCAAPAPCAPPAVPAAR